MAQVQFETGNPRYAWLNETLAVAEARETAAGVEYQLFALAHETQPATQRGCGIRVVDFASAPDTAFRTLPGYNSDLDSEAARLQRSLSVWIWPQISSAAAC